MANEPHDRQRRSEGQEAFWAAVEQELAQRLDNNFEAARARVRSFRQRLPALFEYMQKRDPEFSPELFYHTSPAAIAESLLGEGFTNFEAPESEDAKQAWIERYAELAELDLF